MFKRSLWIVLVLCLFLTACSIPAPTEAPTTAPTETATVAPTATLTPVITPTAAPTATIAPEVYVTLPSDLDTTGKASYIVIPIRDTTPVVSLQDQVLVEYPQIRNFGDAEKEAQLNKMLKDHFFDSILLKKEDYVENCPADLSLGYYTGEITFDVVMQTKDLLSIVYDSDILSYVPGGPEAHPRGKSDIGNNFAITIDLNTMKRMMLSDFTSTSIEIPYPEWMYGDIDHIDLYYRILNSKTVYDQQFNVLLSPSPQKT